ncbi:MAG: hypothetical protein M3096_08880 [Actinomycetia bacterium]|nr:hypothetical protein [Actinomycetes bacterium]
MPELSATDLFDRLRAMRLPLGTYAVFGSGPLAAHGLINEIGDLDVITSEATWKRVEHFGTIEMHGEDPVVDLGNGLTFGRSWAYGDVDVAQLIESAETIDGLPFVRLDAVAAYKRIAARPKDLRHIELMESAGLG